MTYGPHVSKKIHLTKGYLWRQLWIMKVKTYTMMYLIKKSVVFKEFIFGYKSLVISMKVWKFQRKKRMKPLETFFKGRLTKCW